MKVMVDRWRGGYCWWIMNSERGRLFMVFVDFMYWVKKVLGKGCWLRVEEEAPRYVVGWERKQMFCRLCYTHCKWTNVLWYVDLQWWLANGGRRKMVDVCRKSQIVVNHANTRDHFFELFKIRKRDWSAAFCFSLSNRN